MEQNYIDIQRTLVSLEIADIKKTVKELEGLFGSKFPEYVPGTRKERYVESVVKTLKNLSEEITKADRQLIVFDRAMNAAQATIPKITKSTPWYHLQLFRTNKN